MKRSRANAIANDFFREMNPTFWNGNGIKPATFAEKIWEYPLTKEMHLEIVLVYDDVDGWHHCCDLVDTNSNDTIEMISGDGIDSALNLVDTIMDLCKDYE